MQVQYQVEANSVPIPNKHLLTLTSSLRERAPFSEMQLRSCNICEQHKYFPKEKPFECVHNSICFGCLNEYIKSSLVNEKQKMPQCPLENCRKPLRWRSQVVLKYFDVDNISKINQLSKSTLFNEKKMSCSQPDCPGVINHGTCTFCLKVFCEGCYRIEHRGPCSPENPEQLPGVKLCPNCREGIEKDGGCLKMTCSKCNFTFCFECLIEWPGRDHHMSHGLSGGCLGISGWFSECFGARNK